MYRTPSSTAVYTGSVALPGVPTPRTAEQYAAYMRTSEFEPIAQRAVVLLDGRDLQDGEDIEGLLDRAATDVGAVLLAVPPDVLLTARKIVYTGQVAIARDPALRDSPIATAPTGTAGLTVISPRGRDIVRADLSVPVYAGEVAYVLGAAQRQTWWDKYWAVVVIGAAFVVGAVILPAIIGASGAGAGVATTTSAATATTTAAGASGAGVLGTISSAAGLATVGAGAVGAIRTVIANRNAETLPIVAPQQAGMFGGSAWLWVAAGFVVYFVVTAKKG